MSSIALALQQALVQVYIGKNGVCTCKACLGMRIVGAVICVSMILIVCIQISSLVYVNNILLAQLQWAGVPGTIFNI